MIVLFITLNNDLMHCQYNNTGVYGYPVVAHNRHVLRTSNALSSMLMLACPNACNYNADMLIISRYMFTILNAYFRVLVG